MSISISIDRIIQSFFDNKKIQKEQIANYLDAVAMDSELLAECWQKRLAEETNKKSQNSGSNTLEFDTYLKKNVSTSNVIFVSRLKHTYTDATIAFRGNLDKQFQELFMGHLAELLLQRNKIKEEFDAVAHAANTFYLIGQIDNPVKVNSLEDLVGVLHDEAAALKVLARRYRVTI
ncbi:hypothetical protein KFZ76_07010 [Methylovulum psychrotolerans]|uniref:hypothetical protein n=1 Tax=Methylovulum psychrotolerans TaxID=1704499 RepID=UPI001BFF8CC7|nr:hypothetical protein [Methylovulum psychrotolerans]MBT9097460.1 hypothetical protein [Methylovulum psychrotolerans]